MYYVYEEKNLINGMTYTGITCQGEKYRGSGIQLKIDQKIYGLENFKHTTLYRCRSLKQAKSIEKELVDQIAVENPMCYNLVVGGGYPPVYRRFGSENIGSVERSIKCVFDNIEYTSLKEASRVTGVAIETLRIWHKNGKTTLDKTKKVSYRNKVTIGNDTFNSIRSAAKAIGVNHNRIRMWVLDGKSDDRSSTNPQYRNQRVFLN